MKKIGIIILTIFILGGAFFAFRKAQKSKIITSEEAKEIAIKDISNKDGEYTFNNVEYKQNDDIELYTLEFSDKYNFYIYKINAKTKKIISAKKEAIANNKKYMKEDEILNIVFKHAKLNKSDCNLLSNLITLEDSTPIYNPIFYYNETKYSYKVNAYTGAIISVTKINANT